MTAALSATAHAAGLEATLDQYEIAVVMDHPTIIEATLRNNATSPMYITGVEVTLTIGASGEVYNPALLQERLHKLDPGQSWDGPLVVIKPKHRGPLLVKGSIDVKGGMSPGSGNVLASIPLHLTIDDTRRNWDGSYVRDAVPACDRPADACCDASESQCFQSSGRCFYVAEGYDRQQLCANEQGGKVYEHIADLRVSSDGLHAAYLASFQCQSAVHEEHCRRLVVLDQIEQTGPDVPTHLELSPDGRHYVYVARQNCVLRAREDVCWGYSHPVLDGKPVDKLPPW